MEPWRLKTEPWRHGFGSGSALDPDSIRSVDPDPDQDPGQKLRYPQKLKKISFILKCWMSLLRAEGFFCNLDVLYGGLGIGKL